MTDRKMVLVLAAAAFIGLTGVMSLNAFIPAIADDLNTSVSVVGQINTATFILGALIGLVLGPLADHYGLRRTIVLAALLLAISAIATALSTDYWMLLVSRIPAGLGVLGAVSVAIASARLPESERRKGIGWIVSALPLSAILGVPWFALVAHFTHWRFSFVIFSLIVLLVALLLWRFVPMDPPVPETPFSATNVLRAYGPIVRHPPSVFLYLADVLRGVTWFGFLIYSASFFIHDLELTLQGYALFMVAGGTAYLIGTRVSGGQIQRFSLGVVFYSSTVLMAITGVIAFASGLSIAAIMVLLVLFGFMGGVGFPAITIMISEETKGGQGATMMLRNAGLASGQAIGAGAGGALIALGGYATLGFGLGGFALLATVAVFFASRAAELAGAEPAVSGEQVRTKRGQEVMTSSRN